MEGYPNTSWQFPTYHLVSKLEWIAQSWQIFGTVSCCLLRKDVVLLNEKDEEEMIRLYLSCTCFHPQHPSWDQDVLQHYWNLSPDIQLQFYTIIFVLIYSVYKRVSDMNLDFQPSSWFCYLCFGGLLWSKLACGNPGNRNWLIWKKKQVRSSAFCVGTWGAKKKKKHAHTFRNIIICFNIYLYKYIWLYIYIRRCVDVETL